MLTYVRLAVLQCRFVHGEAAVARLVGNPGW
jgi:hypothetical protein